jgi:hypothetical protein
MKKLEKNVNDYSNCSNATEYTEDIEESNRNKSLDNTNDILFNQVNEFILNKSFKQIKTKTQHKKSLNKTFHFNHKYIDEGDDINIEKWFKNKIEIVYNQKNPKKRLYKLYSNEKNKNKSFHSSMLTAEKERGIYIIRNNEGIVAKINWNFLSNHFKVYDDKDNLIEEITYKFNFKGWNGPTKLKVLLPNVEQKQRIWSKNKNKKKMHIIENKTPEYSDFFKVYVLKFKDRKVIPNEKNFQLINTEYKEDGNNILLQFGQSGTNEYFVDYKYPFTNITAFALGLTSLSSRTFCK